MDILSQLLLILYLILTYDTALGDISNNTRVFYMEPPYCHHNITLEYGEEIILESSNRSSVYNQDGVCTAHIWNKNTTKHLIYLFELGPNISDCSVELVFNDGIIRNTRTPVPRYTCENTHSVLTAHTDNYTGRVSSFGAAVSLAPTPYTLACITFTMQVQKVYPDPELQYYAVIRPYTTLRKDFYFRLRVKQMKPWDDHDDNGLGLYVDKSVENPGIPAVLYTILALDFLIPTVIFIINECSGRIEARRKQEDPASLLPSQQDPLNTTTTDQPPQLKVFLNHTTDTDNFKPVHKKAAVGAERQAAFDSEFIKAFDCDEGLKTPPDSRPQSSKQSMITATADVLLFPYLIHSQKGDKTYLKQKNDNSKTNSLLTHNTSGRHASSVTSASPSNRKVAFRDTAEVKDEVTDTPSPTYRRKMTQEIKFSELKGSVDDPITQWLN